MNSTVLRSDNQGLDVLTINRPDKLNSLNVEVFEALDAHLSDLVRQTDTVGLVLLRGAGSCFSAGHDLGDLAKGEQLPRPHFQSQVIERLANLPQPVICAAAGVRLLWRCLALGSLPHGALPLDPPDPHARRGQAGEDRARCANGEAACRRPGRSSRF